MKWVLHKSWWLVLGALVLMAAWMIFTLQREPHSQGNSLSQWFALLREGRPEARLALRAMGPESIPFLVRQANAKEWLPPWRIRRRLPTRLMDGIERRNHQPMEAVVRLIALRDLGVDVRPAMIPLIRGGNSQSPSVSDTSTRLFHDLHEDELPAFFQAIATGNELIRSHWATLVGVSADPVNRKVYDFFRRDESARVRRTAVAYLPINSTNRFWLAPLVRASLKDPSPLVQSRAAITLAYADESLDEVIETARSILNSSDGYEAAFALAAIGPRAVKAIPQLIQRLRSEEVTRPLREAPSSAMALSAIGPAALPALLQELRATNGSSRLSAAIAIRNMKNAPHEVVSPLLECLKSSRIELRIVAAMTLGGLGERSQEVKTALESCLDSDDIYVRSDALRLLRQLEPGRDWNGRGE